MPQLKAKPPLPVLQRGDPLARQLIYALPFYEGGGGNVRDLVKGNNALFSGAVLPTWVKSTLGKAMYTTNSSNQLRTGITAHNTQRTYAFWVLRIGTGGGGIGRLFDKRTVSAQVELFFLNVQWEFDIQTSGVQGVWKWTDSQSTGVWQFVVLTYDRGSVNNDPQLYINGVLQASFSIQRPTGTINTNTDPYIIGNRQNDGLRAFDGYFANFMMWDRLLNPAEISRLFTNPWCLYKRKLGGLGKAPGIAFDAASNSGYQAAQSTYSWSHTVSGSERYLIVGISMLSLAQTVTSIKWNTSESLTFLGAQSSVSGAARVELWGLVAPSTGTFNIDVILSGAIASAGNASSYTGVHQTSPTEAFNSAQATNVGAADATVDVTTVADKDWCVDVVATDDGSITVGAGQTQTGNVTGAGGSGAMSYEGPKTPAGAVTMSWTNIAGLATWSTASIALRPVASSSLASMVKTFLMLMGIGN